jgi:hypothetical protein
LLLLPDRCICIFNTLSYPSGLALNIILIPFLILFIASEVRSFSDHGRKLLSGSAAWQCPKDSDYFCLQAAIAVIHLMTSLGGPLCGFVRFACQKWREGLFQSIDHCSLC